jgi:D-arabinose 1-dehydrogenase-like Zn-dependent alcohol dehydrogenase
MQCPRILFGKRTWQQSLWDGDAVYVFTAKNGDEQCCPVAKWRGIVKDGGFSEYLLLSSYRFLVKVANNQHIWFSLGKLQ